MNLQEYLYILLFIIIAFLLGFILLSIGFILGKKNPNKDKLSAYECGFDTFSEAQMQFDVRYYLVAILFVLFDLEIAFLFPWAASSSVLGDVSFWSAIIFIVILAIGFIYEWLKGAIDWE
ncbi:NADH-quinone oxidoreductase subunit 7 [Candidatus Kinetoplastibacterium sorsogonicusi]|uniref:NADH-quinone oxidoreductase subunit A n=1 Tax=Candidatus Kinetoplastidibacterium kentomonadis TaxID=1576550 RepID=A0A3S7JAB9_9PROT|nr:NADH-quinone oxidoreductase subunit A [Candidatus Kinetoplastibacterium sorsogonicusi]AWD32596.1 NADH-quinone oxidoreductase subunit 7 [Candidatus Kinetoplastibacterium sorsogonicusi]